MAAQKNRTNRRRAALSLALRLLVIVLVLGVSTWGFVYWVPGDHAPAGVEAPPPPALEVSVFQVRRQNVPIEPEFLGMTEASQRVEIRSRVDGFLEERTFEEGATVAQGQLLYRIDSKPFEATLAMARARLETALARLARAQRQVERVRNAAESGAATVTELDEFETEARVANAEVLLAQAQLVQAELNLGYTQIHSPLTGVIGQSEKDVGSYIETGDVNLLTIVQQIDPIYVEYSVSESELLRWQQMIAQDEVQVPAPDQLPIAIELADGSIYPHEGHVNFQGIDISQTTGTAIARGEAPNPDRLLRPGQFVRVHIRGIQRLNTILIPQASVLQSATGAVVYVVNAQNLAEQRSVRLGEWVGDSWVILEGLNEGDRVIKDRLMMLRPGMPVQIVDAAAPPTPPSEPMTDEPQ